MGKKTNSTQKNTASGKSEAPKRQTSTKVGAKKKPTIAAKAAKAVAAVALGVGGAIIAQTKKPATRKPAAKTTDGTESRTPTKSTYTQEDVALRAYFISENRRLSGMAGDSHQDWIEAERQLAEEFGPSHHSPPPSLS